jgi:hypothetical protein
MLPGGSRNDQIIHCAWLSLRKSGKQWEFFDAARVLALSVRSWVWHDRSDHGVVWLSLAVPLILTQSRSNEMLIFNSCRVGQREWGIIWWRESKNLDSEISSKFSDAMGRTSPESPTDSWEYSDLAEGKAFNHVCGTRIRLKSRAELGSLHAHHRLLYGYHSASV